MQSSHMRKLAVSTAAVLAIFVADTQRAGAQNLFDTLFGGGNQLSRPQRQQVREPDPEPARPAPERRAAPPRVSGPSYYTYKTDALVRVDFSAIKPVRASAAMPVDAPAVVDPATVGSTVVDDKAASTPSAMPGSQQAVPAVIATPLSDAQVEALQAFELVAEKEAADALVAHYSSSPELIWVADGQPGERAHDALRTFEDAASHGLDPRDYVLALPTVQDDATLAKFEMELSARVLRYVRDARSGRVDPNRLSGYHDFKRKDLDQQATLNALKTSNDVSGFLEAVHPANAQYAALRAELAKLRKEAADEIVISLGKLLKPGESDAEFSKILALIKRNASEAMLLAHGETLTRNEGSEVYTQELVPVIKAAQTELGIAADGVIGPRTVQMLAGDSKTSRVEKVLIALEQIRWLPSDFTDRHVFINTPAFTATYVEGGEERLSMRTVVGSLATQTYFFQDEIQYVEFHPFWGVPRSILVNKYLPKLYSDPSYLDRSGFEVVDSRGQTIPSSSVDWGRYGANLPYNVRQRPGRSNALGELKIMFPNSHAIYMHDTPDKHLFDRDNRALSNGCIRLADPRAMAAAVLGWDRGQVDARLDQPHSRQNLSVKVPVYVAYFTAWPEISGEVQYFIDVYSRDEKVRAALDKVDALRVSGV